MNKLLYLLLLITIIITSCKKEDKNTNNPPNINLTPGLIGYLNDSENISKTTDGGQSWNIIHELDGDGESISFL